MQVYYDDSMEPSVQEFLPLEQLYDKAMAYAVKHRKTWTDPVPEDDAPRQTRLHKQRHADFVLWHKRMQERMVVKIDRLIEALPGMRVDAEELGRGPEETWVMRSSLGCNCVEKSGSCSGHVFEYDQYFLSWTSDIMTSPNSPEYPRSPESPNATDTEM